MQRPNKRSQSAENLGGLERLCVTTMRKKKCPMCRLEQFYLHLPVCHRSYTVIFVMLSQHLKTSEVNNPAEPNVKDDVAGEAPAGSQVTQTRTERALLALMLVLLLVLATTLMLAALWSPSSGVSKTNKETFLDFRVQRQTADPCQDLYSYSCGNWDVFKKNDEDAYDRLERIVMETGRNWIMQTPVSLDQHRSRDKVMAAYKLCHEVYLGRKENMNDARQYLSRLGLRYYNDSFPVTGIVEFMVKLTMRHGIHTLLAIQPKYDLGNLGDSGNTTRLTISGQSLIVDNWIVDMTESSIMEVAIPFADASFMIDVQKVDRLFRIWINQVPSSYRTPVIGEFDAIANKTPNIDKATWKASINKYLPTPFNENLYLINLHNMWGLLIMSNLKKEFEANTKPVYHWLTMMVHSYLFSATSFEYVLLSRSPTSKCASYIRQVAPFALQALFAHKHVSTDDVALAKRIHRKFVSLSSRVFPWLGGDRSAQERFRNVRVILGIPDILYNPLTMDRHYSYLPKFDEPVVLSILLAFEAKAKHDMFNYQMGMFTSGVQANRYRFKPLREDGVAENFFLGATPLYVPYFSVYFIPPVLLSTIFFAGSSSVSQWASIGRLIARGMVHPFTVANVEKSDVGLLQYWPYDFYSEYALRIACVRNLYDNLIPSQGTRVYADVARDENMADIGGLELLLEGIKNDSCYVPTNPSRITGLSQQQLLFVSYCMSFCGSRASIDSYVPSKIPRRDHRCNVVVQQFDEFRRAFNCPKRPAGTPRCRLLMW